jgi:hypothetical protein
MVLFEYLAPIIEAAGWVIIPVALVTGALDLISFWWLLLLAFGVGLLNSLIALLLDESYGYFNSPTDTSRLLVMALVENLGFRQMTVVWRIRALFGGSSVHSWGDMERRGVAGLAPR